MSAIDSATLLSHLGGLTPETAEYWIAAALSQAAALHQHDSQLYPHDQARLAAAEQLHAAWQEWAENGERLLLQIKGTGRAEHEIKDFDKLRDEVCYAAAMQQLPPAEANRRRIRALNGDVLTIEEARRELQHNSGR